MPPSPLRRASSLSSKSASSPPVQTRYWFVVHGRSLVMRAVMAPSSTLHQAGLSADHPASVRPSKMGSKPGSASAPSATEAGIPKTNAIPARTKAAHDWIEAAMSDPMNASGEDGVDGLAFLDQAHGAAENLDLQLAGVEAELAQDRGVQVAVVMRGIDGLVADVIRAAVDDPASDAAPS